MDCVTVLALFAMLMNWFRLAASIATEDGTGFNCASTSAAAVLTDEEDNDADEEMIMVSMTLDSIIILIIVDLGSLGIHCMLLRFWCYRNCI